MNTKELKKLIEDQHIVRKWLSRINETDEEIISEIMDLMRNREDYREFITTYANTGVIL